MIDRSSGPGAPLLRSPDLRLSDVWTELVEAGPDFARIIEAPGRSVLAFVLAGDFLCKEFPPDAAPRLLTPGTTVGIEDGRPLSWRRASSDPGAARLFLSSIPRRIAILQRLTGGMIVIPAEAEPFATTIRLAIDLHIAQIEAGHGDGEDPVVNRCAEICLLQMIGFARSGRNSDTPAPAAIAHDEQLLAAWTAYFADPLRRWTVGALASAAGMGRTSFAQRFRAAFGTPPLHALTALRLEQAEAMLRDSRAPLIEIAFTVGYNSEAAFVRAFRRHYGITPGRFRVRETGRRG